MVQIILCFKPLEKSVNVGLPRKAKPLQRNGFTAVEWGGILDTNK
ncbi:MAG: hypothetical protein WCO06_00555 [Candidatus Roizmanbacteria bacterium]